MASNPPYAYKTDYSALNKDSCSFEHRMMIMYTDVIFDYTRRD